MPYKSPHSRRNFLRKMSGLTAGLAVSSSALGNIKMPAEKTLEFYNLHTGESLSTAFYAGHQFLPQGLHDINYLLRDHRNNQVFSMDPELLSLLHDLRNMLGVSKPIHVISAYRSPESNAMLSERSNQVAKKSLHMQGKAIDIRIPGIQTKHLQQAALSLKGGGVGLYTRSDFVHIDVGRVRHWGS